MKQSDRIENALRQVAKQRDKLLREVPALSPARQASLTDCLAREFPLETALRGAATKRDQLLPLYRSGIPTSVESILHRQLDALKAAGLARAPRKLDGLKPSSLSLQQLRGDGVHISDSVNRTSVWLTFFRSPLGGVLAVCAMITAAILCFGRWETPSRRNAENFPHTPRVDIESGVILESGLFTRKVVIAPFNLNKNEPASLQASFFANSEVYLANASEAPLGLRLDLPVRAILTGDGIARTP